MDSDNFFGFDASFPPEDEGVEPDDDLYDALNDETFGSAAVGGDWEENHKQLSSLTEAERFRRFNNRAASSSLPNNIDLRLEELHNNEELRKTIENLALEKPSDRRLYERSIDSSLLADFQKELSSSPGSSIWSPTLGLEAFDGLRASKKDDINLALKQHLNNSNRQSYSNGLHHLNNSMPFVGSPMNIGKAITMVGELEDEMRRQYSLNNIAMKHPAMTVTDLEKHALNSRNGPLLAANDFQNARQSGFNFLNSQSHLMGKGLHHPGHHMSESPSSFANNSGGSKPLNCPNAMQYHLFNTSSNKYHGFPNNTGNHHGMNNSNNFPNRHMGPFNHQHPRPSHPNMGDNRNYFHGGNNHNRNNFGRNNMERRNFDQNYRYDMPRNHHDHQREACHGSRPNEEFFGGGNRIRRDSDAEWEEWQRIRQVDEYAGLMTPREKGWLRNIQSMQLQTDKPYQDDYYFIMYNVKQQHKREEEVIEIDGGLQLLLHDRGKEGKEYEPPKLENSLGKLQVASVNAPRKIIDLQVVHLDSSHPTTTLQRDMRRHRHLLLNIEKLYNTQIQLDDLKRKIRVLPDCPTRDIFKSKCRQLVTKLWDGLISPHESFVQTLCIRKGKTLAARLLSWVSEDEVEHLLATVIQNLSLLTKKDVQDKRLQLFWPIADRFFASSSASTIVTFGIMMGDQLKVQKNHFIPALANRLGLSMVLSLLVRGEQLYSDLENDDVWQKFLRDTILALNTISLQEEISPQPLPSVSFAASPRNPSTQINRCKNVEASSVHHATEVLKRLEGYLMQNTPGPSSSSLSTNFGPNDTNNQPTTNDGLRLRFSNTANCISQKHL